MRWPSPALSVISYFWLVYSVDASSQSFCLESLNKNKFSAEISSFETTSAALQPDQALRLKRFQLGALLHQSQTKNNQSSDWSMRVQHQYQVFNITTTSQLQPQTNGHLHSLSLPMQWRSSNSDSPIRVTLVPSLASSSNILKNPRELTRDDFWFGFSAHKTIQQSPQFSWLFGICSDRRLGRDKTYLIAGLLSKFNSAWELLLSYPDSLLTYQVQTDLRWYFSIAPGGHQWHVSNKELTNSSKFSSQSWHISSGFNWYVTNQLSVDLSFGQKTNHRLNYLSQSNSLVDVDIDDSILFQLAIAWDFK